MKKLLLIMAIMSLVYGQKDFQNYIVQRDTVFVDSLAVAYSKAFKLYESGVKTVMIEANDTTHAGYGDDSARVSIELMQVIPITDSLYRVLPSHAHPDSTTYPFSSKYMLTDSINIKTMMDTACTYSRVAVKKISIFGDSVVDYWSNQINTARATANACIYKAIVPDGTPLVCLKYTGKIGNQHNGGGSRWITTWISEKGTPIYTIK